MNNQEAAAGVNDTLLEDYQKGLRNFQYFNAGFKGDELAANFSTCGDRGAYYYYLERPTYKIKMMYGDGEENTFNTTKFLQNTTNTLSICTDAAENIWYFIQWKKEQFPSTSDFMLGFLQNLLANVIRLNRINDKITELQEEEKETGVDNSEYELYYIGLVLRILFVFEPINDELTRSELRMESPTAALYVQEGLVTAAPATEVNEHPMLAQESEEAGNGKTGMEVFMTP